MNSFVAFAQGGERGDARTPDRHGGSRVFPPLERQTHPARPRCGRTITPAKTKRRCFGCPRASQITTAAWRPIGLGSISEERFLSRIAGTAGGIEGNDARNYISPANASVSTWVGYDTPVAFGISYYSQGENLAALLDLSIRNDTDGRAGLDDVMRALYNDFYKRGKGFTTADMIGIIGRLTKKDYNDFYNRYVFGTDVPDYEKIFGYAGYRLDRKTQAVPEFGWTLRSRSGGYMINRIEPNSPAARAGLPRG